MFMVNWKIIIFHALCSPFSPLKFRQLFVMYRPHRGLVAMCGPVRTPWVLFL